MPQPKLKVQLKRFDEEAVIPEYKSRGAAGFDLHACIPGIGFVVISPGETLVVPTGVGIFLKNPDYCLEIWERSGFGVRGIARRAGLVDSDYQGEISVVLTNHTDTDLTISHGHRIAQAKVAPVQRVIFDVVEEFDTVTERGPAGFGSTGV